MSTPLCTCAEVQYPELLHVHTLTVLMMENKLITKGPCIYTEKINFFKLLYSTNCTCQRTIAWEGEVATMGVRIMVHFYSIHPFSLYLASH